LNKEHDAFVFEFAARCDDDHGRPKQRVEQDPKHIFGTLASSYTREVDAYTTVATVVVEIMGSSITVLRALIDTNLE
jgi:hypothetical protein